jgi:membrane protein YdbS with pleckstrin-like domain
LEKEKEVRVMEINKYVFGSIALIALVGLQITAWYFGFNGNIQSLCTGGITAVIAFVIGIEINIKKSK